MKRLWYFFLVGVFAFTSGCIDTAGDLDPFEYTAEVIGLDEALCACCGGMIVEINHSDEAFRVHEYSEEFQALVDANDFPVTINLDFTRVDTCTSIVFITVDDFEIM